MLQELSKGSENTGEVLKQPWGFVGLQGSLHSVWLRSDQPLKLIALESDVLIYSSESN